MKACFGYPVPAGYLDVRPRWEFCLGASMNVPVAVILTRPR
jgi:hypothetical protein